MNRKGFLALVVVLMLAAGCAPKANPPDDVAAIKAMSTSYAQAFTAGDTIALGELYADDAVSLGANAPILIGKQAIVAVLQADLDEYAWQESDVTEDVQVLGDLAYARGTYAQQGTPRVPGAAIIADKGKWVSVYRRQPNSSWKIVADIWNSDLPAVETLMPASADEQALLQLERDWAAAFLKQDAAAIDLILADDFVENSKDKSTTKKEYLAQMRSGIQKVESVELSDMRAVVFGDHAVVNGAAVAKSTVRGKDQSGKNRWTDVYARRDGRWRAVVSYNVKTE